MKSPEDKTIVFTFASHPMEDPKARWRAEMTFPPGSTAETALPISVTDGTGAPVKAGVFEFAGQRLDVSDGRASMTFATFVAGKHSVSLWLYREGFSPVPGGATFG